MKFPSASNHTRVWNICAAVVVLGLALSSVGEDSFHRSFLNAVAPGVPIDFPHYYVAGRLARLYAPENLLYYPPPDHRATSYLDLRVNSTTPYGTRTGRGDLPDRAVTRPFIAPPFAALILIPLASLPWKTAYLVWQLLCVLMMMASVYLVLRLSQESAPPVLVTALALALALLFLPFQRGLGLGNIDVILLFLWALGVLLLDRGRVVPSALCFALGTAIKVNPVLALPLFVLRRQWRWLVSYGVGSAALLGISVWGVGWQNHVVWARQVSPALACGINSFWNRSLAGFVFALNQPQRLLIDLPGPAGWCLFNKVVSAVGYLAFLFWCWRKRRDSRGLVFQMILLPFVVLLVLPINWSHNYVISLVPLTFLWVRSREHAAAISKVDLILLTAATLILGSGVPDYLARAVGPLGELLVMGAWIAAALALIAVGVRLYGSCVIAGERATVAHSGSHADEDPKGWEVAREKVPW